MKKSDLQNGMVVETRGREVYLLVGDILMGQCGYNNLSEYDENLLYEEAPFFDIMTVYAPAKYLDEVIDMGSLPILWTREWRPQQSDIYIILPRLMSETYIEKLIGAVSTQT